MGEARILLRSDAVVTSSDPAEVVSCATVSAAATPARTARSASYSCAEGQPKQTNNPSPSHLAT